MVNACSVLTKLTDPGGPAGQELNDLWDLQAGKRLWPSIKLYPPE